MLVCTGCPLCGAAGELPLQNPALAAAAERWVALWEATRRCGRAQLRAAQARLTELSQNFRALQSEVARHRYEQDGTAMPVASAFPLRIDPML